MRSGMLCGLETCVCCGDRTGAWYVSCTYLASLIAPGRGP
jgi:hypothetical protein